MKKKMLGIAGVFVVVTILMAEILLRIPISEKYKSELYRDRYMMTLLSRVNPVWINPKKEQDLLPPFDVFANTETDVPARLEKIFSQNRRIQNTKIVSYNFLKPENQKTETAYTSYFNNLGFRSRRDFKAEKEKNEFRIMTYGSYQAFGYGLDEEYSYNTLLEQELNKPKPKKDYRVWNSGRLAGTAIVGLSQYIHDSNAYKPDLVIFDYGFVDAFIIRDNFFPSMLHFDFDLKSALDGPLTAINFLIGNSMVFYKYWTYLSKDQVLPNVLNFRKSFVAFLQLAEKNKTPVIVIRQPPVAIPPKFFLEVLSTYKDVYFIDVPEIFNRNYERFKDKAQGRTFWMNEVPMEERAYLQKIDNYKYPNLKLDLWQINEDGQRLVADELVRIVRSMKFTR